MNLNLLTQHPNVPNEKMPVWWRMDRSLDYNIAQVQRWMAHYDYALRPGERIDEVSILTMDFDRVRDYLRQDDDWELFNTAEDVVFTNPFGTRYTVGYRFYRHPLLPWRIEVMVLGNQAGDLGISPLHAALWGQTVRMRDDNIDLLPIPHLSYKPTRRYAEGDANALPLRRSFSLAVQHLRDKALIPAQTCQSTYGIFGYYLGNETARQIYLKPRVNLRDEQATCGRPYPCEHAPNGGNHPVVGA